MIVFQEKNSMSCIAEAFSFKAKQIIYEVAEIQNPLKYPVHYRKITEAVCESMSLRKPFSFNLHITGIQWVWCGCG